MKRNSLRFFQKNILVIAASGAVKSFGGGLTSTYVSLYFVELGGNPFTLGFVASCALLVQSVMLLLGGSIADYYGRRKVIVLTALYGVFFPSLYAIVRDWRLFAALSVIAAVGVVSNPASHAIVADSIPPEKRTIGIASLQVLSSLPAIVSPLIGGWLIQNHGLLNGFRFACMYVAATAFASALILCFFLKETLRPRSAAEPTYLNSTALTGFVKLSGSFSPSLKALMVSYSLVTFANGAVGQYYVIFANGVIGLTPLEWGVVVSLQSLLASALKIPGGWFSDRFGKKKVMIISVLTCSPLPILFTMSRSFLGALTVALLLIVTGIYYAPAHEALQADLTPRPLRGRITALWDIGRVSSGALGTLLGGFLFQTINQALPFYLFTVAELTAVLLIITIVKEPATKEV